MNYVMITHRHTISLAYSLPKFPVGYINDTKVCENIVLIP